jgi:glycosyltransferase involved in cell wall biosynthesis
MKTILLTVSGVIPPDLDTRIAAGQRPRADYLELARALPATLIDYATMRANGGLAGRLIERVAGPNAALAWACFRQRGHFQVIFTDGEQVGIPLALLLKGLGRGPQKTRHAMIVHILSVGKKMLFFDRLGIASHVDRFLVYATRQKEFIEQRWDVPPARVLWTPFQVDDQFFRPDFPADELPAGVPASDSPMICSVGLEFRDYPTLMAAVEGVNVRAVLAAASPWSKRDDTTQGQTIPTNVLVRRFSQFELRQVYAHSRFVVMPLYPVEFQAGVTAILEAMAMGKAVICTRTPGQTDVVVEGETGLYVPPQDPAALRQAIQFLLDHPEEAARMGAKGRKVIETQMNLDQYVFGLKQMVDNL